LKERGIQFWKLRARGCQVKKDDHERAHQRALAGQSCVTIRGARVQMQGAAARAHNKTGAMSQMGGPAVHAAIRVAKTTGVT